MEGIALSILGAACVITFAIMTGVFKIVDAIDDLKNMIASLDSNHKRKDQQ